MDVKCVMFLFSAGPLLFRMICGSLFLFVFVCSVLVVQNCNDVSESPYIISQCVVSQRHVNVLHVQYLMM